MKVYLLIEDIPAEDTLDERSEAGIVGVYATRAALLVGATQYVQAYFQTTGEHEDSSTEEVFKDFDLERDDEIHVSEDVWLTISEREVQG